MKRLYKHVHVYARDLSVNRLLMRRAVLRNKIMAFVCVGEIITNVSAHIFSAAMDARGGGGHNIWGLRTEQLTKCYDLVLWFLLFYVLVFIFCAVGALRILSYFS